MKITRIQVDNFLGIHSVDAALNTPIALFCGSNAAGKSSIREAVRMAVTGEAGRVKLIKEYDQLVADGAKAGGALISVGDLTYAFDVPSGKGKTDEELPTGASIAVALDGQRFASMSPDDKRTFLFNVTGCKASTEEVKKRLVSRKCNEAKIEAILPLLRTSFPSACKQAETNATESKRDWKNGTGAVWGSKVADNWKAPQPAALGDTVVKPDDLVALDAEIGSLNQKIGAAAAEIRAAGEAATKREQLKTKAESVDRVREQRDRAEAELEELLPKVEDLRQRASGTARVGLVHQMAIALSEMINLPQDTSTEAYINAVHALDAYESEHGSVDIVGVDQDAKSSLPEFERGLEVLQNAAGNLDRDLEQAIAAKTAYDALSDADAVKHSAGDLEALQTRLATLKASRDKLQADIRAVEDYALAVTMSEIKTVSAAKHHIDVTEWLAIAAALAPDGIPGDLLAEALKPINSTLQIAACDTEWPQIYISPDMQITAGKRSYTLLSESEQWRVDAMFAQAIAKISGLKILMLDRVDVLDLPGRVQLLQWLDMLVEDGHIETALLFATLKGMPTGLPPSITPFWLANGSIAEYKAAA